MTHPVTQPVTPPATQPVTPPATQPVTDLLSSLEGLDRHPLVVQAERLEAVRRGLDEALARPGADRSPVDGHG